jgi:hypothetical protein
MHAEHVHQSSRHIPADAQTCDETCLSWDGQSGMLVRCGVNEVLPAVDVVATCFRRLYERARKCMPHGAWHSVCVDAVAALEYDAPCKAHRARPTETNLPAVQCKQELARTLRSMLAEDAAQPLAAEYQDSQVRANCCKLHAQAHVWDHVRS